MFLCHRCRSKTSSTPPCSIVSTVSKTVPTSHWFPPHWVDLVSERAMPRAIGLFDLGRPLQESRDVEMH